MSSKIQSIQHYFERQVASTPNNVALKFYEDSLTYSELNTKANQLAHSLLHVNVMPKSRVAICIERSMEQIVAILGVLKAGAAYVPIDPALPKKKIDNILNAIDVGIALVHDRTITNFYDRDILNLDDLPIRNKINPQIKTSDDYLAYVIYTSGSTGRPKGVMVEHRAVINLIESQICNFNISLERILLTSEIFFDASIEQIFLALISGSTLICLNHTTLTDKDKLEDYILDQKITHLHAIPTLLNQLDLKISSVLKRIISGGEVCPVSLANKWIGVCDFYNEYGPTETTCTSVMAKLNHPVEDLVPIGRPLSNVECYVVKDNKKCPAGVEGELWIAGKGVARGYSNSPQLTQEKFIVTDLAGERVYKTGDVCRWSASGDLEFLRRNDLQVKLRGYRIEVQEIETVIISYPGILNSIVILADGILVAFCQGDTGGLKCYLETQLAAYMIPAHIIEVEKFPTTSCGKIDRSKLKNNYVSLPAPSQSSSKVGLIQTKVLEIWQEVLMTDNFDETHSFYCVGGDSLRAMQVVIKIREVFKVNMKMCYFISNPYIDSCVDYLLKFDNDS